MQFRRFRHGGFFKTVFSLQIVLIVLFVVGVFLIAPTVGLVLDGALDRIDYVIGYEAKP